MEPAWPPADALIVVLPFDPGVAKPVLETVATLVLLELHAQLFVMSTNVPSDSAAVAVNCWVCPVASVSDTFVGERLMLEIVLVLTVSTAVPVTSLLFDFAVMVVVPAATAVALPELSIVATLGDDEDHETLVVRPALLFPKVAVAVNCWVACGLIHAPVGDSVSETMVSDEGKKPPQLVNRLAMNSPARLKLALPTANRHLETEPKWRSRAKILDFLLHDLRFARKASE